MNKIELIKALLSDESCSQSNETSFWRLGKTYVIRTVTMIYLGDLKEIAKDELILEDCAWIPETSRWNEFLSGKKPNEMEPYPNDVLIGRGAILDVTEYKEKIKREVI